MDKNMPSTKDTIGCATEVKQPAVPNVKIAQDIVNYKIWCKEEEYKRWYGKSKK